MFKLRHKPTKLVKKISLIIALVAVSTGVFLAVPGKASAATFYNTDNKVACNSGDLKVTKPPYTDPDSQKLFYCVSGLQQSEWTPIGQKPGGKCPSGVAGADAGGFGVLCLDKLKDPTVTAPINAGDTQGKYVCGAGDRQQVHLAINLGCKGQGNPILDLLFAIVRFLSLGVGLVIIGSIIVAGIQYTTSRGDPQATSRALARIRETMIALAIFIFTYAIINWLVPAGLLK